MIKIKGENMGDNQILMQLAANLAEVCARNGASFISNKIRASKTKKMIKKPLLNLKKLYLIY